MPYNKVFHGLIGDGAAQVMVWHRAGEGGKITLTIQRNGRDEWIELTYPEIYALIGMLQGANMRLRDGEK